MKHSEEPCHYTTLGIDQYASETEVRKAFRKKVSTTTTTMSRPIELKRYNITQAKKCHPDKNLNSPERAANEFKILSVAYEILSDAGKRAKYDAKIQKRKTSFSVSSTSRRYMREAMKEATNIGRHKHFKARYASTFSHNRKPFSYSQKSQYQKSDSYSDTSQSMSEAYEEFAENVDKIQARWQKLQKEARKFRNIPDSPIPTASTKGEFMHTPSPPPPPPPPPFSSTSSSTKSLTPISFNNREKRHDDEEETLPSSSSSFRNLSERLDAKVRGVENIQRMKRHIRLLDKLKKDQKSMVDTQIKLCKERQEFWKQYNIKIGHEQKKRTELRRQFKEQAAKMEALRKRHERQRASRRSYLGRV